MTKRFGWILLGALALTVVACISEGVVGRDVLGKIVSTQCVPDMTKNAAPVPCTEVDMSRGYAVLKDIRGGTQYLLIPTIAVTGIEDPILLDPKTPNYFAAAWQVRHYTASAVGVDLPPQDFILAVNAPGSRSQDQLHIHIDCIRQDVRDELHDHLGAVVASSWSPFPVPLAGHNYLARRQNNLEGATPFQLLADGLPMARSLMKQYTLAVAGAVFEDGKPGFIMLAERADTGHSEELQDHSCAVAH